MNFRLGEQLYPIIVTALLLAFVQLYCLPATALPAHVKVKLFSSQHDLKQIFLYAPFKIVSPAPHMVSAGRFVIEVDRKNSKDVRLRSVAGNGQINLKQATLLVEGQPLQLACLKNAPARFYRGSVMFRCNSEGKLLAVNTVDTKSYITSCVGSEALASFATEALKAQTVLSTTLLDRNVGKNPSGFILDNTEEQSYLGVGAERLNVKAAVDSVFGQELYYRGRPVEVFFGSTCGGTTARPEIFGADIKTGSYPYLQEVSCNYCKASPFFKMHSSTIERERFAQITGLAKLAVDSTRKGRPLAIDAIENRTGNAVKISGYQFWLTIGQKLGWGFVPSTCYKIDATTDAKKYNFLSRGCGHGVGLCQWGADGQARAGRGYKEILLFYYPGTNLKVVGRES